MVDRSQPGPEPVLVSVLIPILNEAEHIQATVERLQNQVLPDGEIEILLIDGGSTDGTLDVLERLAESEPRVRVLENPQRTISCGLNVGLREARGRVIARVDAHSLTPPDYLAHGVKRLARGDVASVSGPQLAVGEGRWSRPIALALGTSLGIGGASFRRAGEEIEVDSGFLGVWLRSTLVQHGGWDESWLVNEDGELAARIRERGGRIVCIPEMAVDYLPRDALPALARQYWSYGRYRAKTCRAHPASMRRSHLLPPALAVTAVAAVAAPRPASRLARLSLGVYAVALAATGASQARTAQPRDAAGIVLALATMHLSWGFGFLAGCLRFGPPLRAVAGAVGENRTQSLG